MLSLCLLTRSSQVQASYPSDLASLPTDLASLLDAHGGSLAPQLRKSLVQALILLHNRGAVDVRSVALHSLQPC